MKYLGSREKLGAAAVVLLGALLFYVSLASKVPPSNPVLPTQEKIRIIAACTKFLEALRLGQESALLQTTAPNSNGNSIIHLKRPFSFVDMYRLSLRLKNKTTPVEPKALTISTRCSWGLLKDIIAENYAGYPPNRLSPLTAVVVEYKYMESQLPVVIPVVKVGNQWLITCMPSKNTGIYKFKRLNDLYDILFSANHKNYYQYCIKLLNPKTGKEMR